MNINYATTNKEIAKKYLKSEKYNFLSDDRKRIILENLGKDCRVQDPLMYHKPRITVFNQHIADLINKKVD